VLCAYTRKMSASNVKLVSSPAVDGLPPVTDAKSGMAAVLHILMKHMADCLHLVLDSVVEKYGLDKEEVMRVITESPHWKELPVNPLIHDLGYVLPGSELAAAEPAAVKEEPAAVKEEPAAVKEEPAAVKEEPAAVKEEPAAVKEEPAAVKEEPAAPAPVAAINVCPEIEDTAKLLKEIDEVLEATPTPATQPKKRVVIKKVKPAVPAPAPAEVVAEETLVTPPIEPPADAVTAAPAEVVVAPPPAPPKKKIAVTRVKKTEATKPASP
jgi:hypothetical protein